MLSSAAQSLLGMLTLNPSHQLRHTPLFFFSSYKNVKPDEITAQKKRTHPKKKIKDIKIKLIDGSIVPISDQSIGRFD